MTALRDPTVELYELILRNPSVFGRLVHIAGLWNGETGRYERGLPERLRTAEIDKALSRWHQAFFVDWLAQSLAEKERDISLYWAHVGGTRDQVKKIRESGEAAIPPLVREEERRLFLQDLAFIQALL
jgi:hypothetical protein